VHIPVNLFRDLDQFPEQFRHGAVSIGNFDGVHLGHARIVERLLAMADKIGGPAVVFTFDPHPARLLRPDLAPAPLGWTDRKVHLLAELGVDAVVIFPTDREFLELEARRFFQRIVRGRLAARAMVEGPDFFFGHNRTGNVEVLRRFCDEAEIELQVVEPVQVDGLNVSSSRIRSLIAEGCIDRAGSMLGRPYRVRGKVVRGASRGRTLGFPTANVGQIDTLLPSEGIYAGMARVENTSWPAAINVGPNPTFGEASLKFEVFMIGYQGDLYDRAIEVDLLVRLRDIRRFESVEQLTAQVDRDVTATVEVCKQLQPQT